LAIGVALTVAGSAPHIATLAGRGNRRITNTTVYADGVALSDAFVSYNAAFVLGTAAGTFDLSTNHAFSIEMDGNLPLTIILAYNAAPSAPAVNGTEITVEATFSGAGGNAATRAEVAQAINDGLAAATNAALSVTSGGYGTAYASVASDGTTGILITSPITTPSSDVRVFASIDDSGFTTGSTAMTTLFGAASFDATTVVEISATVFDSGAAYTIDYIAIEDYIDAAAQSAPRTFLKVGAYPGVGTFVEDTDYAVDGSSDLDWSNATATGVITNATTDSLDGGTGTPSGTFDLSTNDQVRLAFDGQAAVTIDLVQASAPAIGFIASGSLVNGSGGVTAAEVAANINAVLANDVNYGARYASVASASGNIVTLTSPNDGTASSIAITHASTVDATSEIFGLSASQTLTVTGTGTRPTSASVTERDRRP